jgi:hypothetical protein
MMIYFQSQSRIHKIHNKPRLHDYYELVQENLQGEQNNIILLAIYKDHNCAADFSLLNLPKGKSLGRSKPATNS